MPTENSSLGLAAQASHATGAVCARFGFALLAPDRSPIPADRHV